MNGQFEKDQDDAWYLVISDKDDVYKKNKNNSRCTSYLVY